MISRGELKRRAMRLPVGATQRITLPGDKRPNTVIGHDDGRYWAYCQKRKQGVVVPKEHARYNSEVAKRSLITELPRDMQLCCEMDAFDIAPLAGFLAEKGMDFIYLPEDTAYSPSRMRLIVRTPQGSMGRDISGQSPQKWLSYDKAQWLGPPDPGYEAKPFVVVEDPFSYFKGVFAYPEADWYCSIGTEVRPALALHLATYYKRGLVFYDGDAAGDRGRLSEARKLRGMGLKCRGRQATAGLDPKDMQLAEIASVVQHHLGEIR